MDLSRVLKRENSKDGMQTQLWLQMPQVLSLPHHACKQKLLPSPFQFFFFWLHPMACRIPSPGVKPASPTLQGRFLTTGPSGKLWAPFLSQIFLVRNLPLLKSRRTLWGLSQVQKSFCVLFLFCRKRSRPPRPSLSSKGQIQKVTN